VARKPIRSDLGWSTVDRIFVRGKDLPGEILGTLNLGDMAFFELTGRVPNPKESRLFNAMAVNTRMAELLLPMLSLPFFVPVVMAAAQSSARLMAGRLVAEAMPWLRILVAYDIVFVTACTLAFPYTLDE